MRVSLIAIFALGGQALLLEKRDNPSILGLGFDTRRVNNPTTVAKRASDAIELSLVSPDQVGYYVNFKLGTPPQNLSAQLDTGSSNLVLLTTYINECKTSPDDCVGGAFDPDTSSTIVWSDEVSSGSYGDGTTYSGYYGADKINIGGASFEFEFAGALNYTEGRTGASINSIFGIGINLLEDPTGYTYPNLPLAFAKAGVINTAAYSLYLQDKDRGHILFGGVNKAKYSGPLKTFDIPSDNESQSQDRTLVVLSGFGVTRNGKHTDSQFTPRPVLLDSGSTVSELSSEMFSYLAENVEIYYDSTLGFVAPCESDSKDTVDFTFGDLTISVPVSEFFVSFLQPQYRDGVAYCALATSNQDSISLGDNFLRYAYVVYDLDNLQISLAQANPTGSPDDIVEIVSDVPGATVDTVIATEYLVFDSMTTGAGAFVTGATTITLSTDSATSTATSSPLKGKNSAARQVPKAISSILMASLIGWFLV